MAVIKADTLVKNGKSETYSDFFTSFAASPAGGALAKKTDEEAVKQSIRNLINTNLGDRLYQPLVGSNIYKSLFEPNDIIASLDIETGIENVIRYYEPRVGKIHVSATPSEDGDIMIVRILFYVINNPKQIDLTINLKRVR